ncbi:hypothetical protein L218DRAFT_1075358 [Marasmius fiardii PR-910]|nr:hypothetical protein L218DRAFT_1075358 [Marasmius fiardii PR-910]
MGSRNRSQTQAPRSLYHPYKSRHYGSRSLMAEPIQPVCRSPLATPTSQDCTSTLRNEVEIAIRQAPQDDASHLRTNHSTFFDVDNGLNSRSSLTLKTTGGAFQSVFMTNVIKDIIRHATECEIYFTPSVTKIQESSEKLCSGARGVDCEMTENNSATALNKLAKSSSMDAQPSKMRIPQARQRLTNLDVIKQALDMETTHKSKRKSVQTLKESECIPSLLSRITPATAETSVFDKSTLHSVASTDSTIESLPGERKGSAQAFQEPRITPSLLSRLSPAIDHAATAGIPRSTMKKPHDRRKAPSLLSRISHVVDSDSSVPDIPLSRCSPMTGKRKESRKQVVRESERTLLSRISPAANDSSVVDTPLSSSQTDNTAKGSDRDREAHLRNILLARRSTA